jgi:hypothetical protein
MIPTQFIPVPESIEYGAQFSRQLTARRHGDPPASPEGEADGGQAGRNEDAVIGGQKADNRGQRTDFGLQISDCGCGMWDVGCEIRFTVHRLPFTT